MEKGLSLDDVHQLRSPKKKRNKGRDLPVDEEGRSDEMSEEGPTSKRDVVLPHDAMLQ